MESETGQVKSCNLRCFRCGQHLGYEPMTHKKLCPVREESWIRASRGVPFIATVLQSPWPPSNLTSPFLYERSYLIDIGQFLTFQFISDFLWLFSECDGCERNPPWDTSTDRPSTFAIVTSCEGNPPSDTSTYCTRKKRNITRCPKVGFLRNRRKLWKKPTLRHSTNRPSCWTHMKGIITVRM